MTYNDPSGHYAETFLDAAFIGYDLDEIRKDPGNIVNYLALGADFVGALTPGFTGLGLGVRGLHAASLATKIEHATVFGKVAEENKALFKSSTKNNLRENLKILTGETGELAQAHHVFPKAKEFSSTFERAGINIHEPRYGAWWSNIKGDKLNHSSNALNYNTDWRDFFRQGDKSKSDILNQGRKMSEKYGFKLNY